MFLSKRAQKRATLSDTNKCDASDKLTAGRPTFPLKFACLQRLMIGERLHNFCSLEEGMSGNWYDKSLDALTPRPPLQWSTAQPPSLTCIHYFYVPLCLRYVCVSSICLMLYGWICCRTEAVLCGFYSHSVHNIHSIC